MFTQSQTNEVKTSKQQRNLNQRTTAMTVAPHIATPNHQTMIAEAAYYAAQRRGFVPGFELDDWLTAEREIEKMLPRKD